MNKYTIADFNKDFPDDNACLEWLKDNLYPDGIHCKVCDKITPHSKLSNIPVYSCNRCGNHTHPMAGTIFERSRTPLKSWFYAIYLMSATRCGISAKQLERELGVTYKTAWRMAREIRHKLMTQTDKPIGTLAQVEIDETYIGGKAKNMHKAKRERIGGRGTAGKVAVFGAVERKGQVIAVTVPNVDKLTLLPQVKKHVLPASIVYTDEMSAYDPLIDNGYKHHRINHSEKIYISGDVHTNTIEGFWSLLKRSIGGVYHSVSEKYLQGYINEYGFRYNHRKDEKPMFGIILSQIKKLA
jgi:transposase